MVSRVSSGSCASWRQELVTGQKEARPVPDGLKGVCFSSRGRAWLRCWGGIVAALAAHN